jgi:RNA polymerase sigma factor (sigma-70 family)
LSRAADAIDRTGGARELADAIYGELFSKSLFRYFHGRSSLATWLRSLLSQRFVDRFRETRRLDALPDDEIAAASSAASPDQSRFVAAMQAVLAAAIAALDARDRLRLRCYYAEDMTLAQIGRVTRESEATVSRQLARTRRTLREQLTERLKREHGFSESEIAECVSSVSGDAGTLDLGQLLNSRSSRSATGEGGRKKEPLDRSEYEDVS